MEPLGCGYEKRSSGHKCMEYHHAEADLFQMTWHGERHTRMSFFSLNFQWFPVNATVWLNWSQDCQNRPDKYPILVACWLFAVYWVYWFYSETLATHDIRIPMYCHVTGMGRSVIRLWCCSPHSMWEGRKLPSTIFMSWTGDWLFY